MKPLLFLLSAVVALYGAVDGTLVKSDDRLLTMRLPLSSPDVVQILQEIIDAGGIPNLILAIVNQTRPAEVGA